MPDFQEEFANLSAWNTSFNTLPSCSIYSTGYTTAPSCMRVNANLGAAGGTGGTIAKNGVTNLDNLPNVWYYTSFAVYINNWSDIWNDPTFGFFDLFSFDYSTWNTFHTFATASFYLQASSSSAGDLWFANQLVYSNIPAGQWVALELALKFNSGGSTIDTQAWVNNTAGSIVSYGSGSANINGLILGADTNGGTIWIDDFNFTKGSRIGPVSLAGAVTPTPPVNPSGGGNPSTSGIRFTVKHYDKNGNLLVELSPVHNSLAWSYQLGNVNGPGTIACDFALFQTVDATPEGTRLITPDLFAPYATDWALYMYVDSAPAVRLMDGICTGVNLRNETGVVSFQGMDNLHFLEQPYPFDYSQTVAQWLSIGDSNKYWNASAGSDTTAVTYNATQQIVVNALITSLTSAAYNYYRPAPNIVPSFVGTAWSHSLNYNVPWGDQTTILAHLQAISKLYDPRGFDFWMGVNGAMSCVGPRVLNPNSLVPQLYLSDATTIVDIDWTNTGPRATETIAIGSGLGNGRPWYMDTYPPSQSAYRRWKRIANFSNPGASLTSAPDVILGLASATGFLDRFPQKELKLRVKPDALFPNDNAGGFYSILGEALNVAYTFTPYHRISADFYVTGQTYSTDVSGNFVCDFTLDQVYGTITTPPIQ